MDENRKARQQKSDNQLLSSIRSYDVEKARQNLKQKTNFKSDDIRQDLKEIGELILFELSRRYSLFSSKTINDSEIISLIDILKLLMQNGANPGWKIKPTGISFCNDGSLEIFSWEPSIEIPTICFIFFIESIWEYKQITHSSIIMETIRSYLKHIENPPIETCIPYFTYLRCNNSKFKENIILSFRDALVSVIATNKPEQSMIDDVDNSQIFF